MLDADHFGRDDLIAEINRLEDLLAARDTTIAELKAEVRDLELEMREEYPGE